MAKSLHARRYRNVPVFLRKLRENAGLTQRELASKLKVMQSTVHKSEIGERRVDISEFIDWAVACGEDPLAAVGNLLKSEQ